MALCDVLGWLPSNRMLDSPEADFAALASFHDAGYIDALRQAEVSGRIAPEVRLRHNIGTLENPVFAGLFQRAALTVGGSVLAAQKAASGGVAFHPAGGTHHGMRDRASGFCYFNDPVFAIRTLIDLGKARVLYVDLDAHHGDGVEAAFAGDPRVRLISVHEQGRWPGTAQMSDRRADNAYNLAVPAGMNDAEFSVLMDRAVLPLGHAFAPDAVVITCGADALQGDPLSALCLSNGALWDAVQALVGLSPSTVVLGGGGYNPWTVARAWAGLWGRLAGNALPDPLPEAARQILMSLSCDLVDADDMLPHWTRTLIDPPNGGPVRPRFFEIAAAVRAYDDTTAALETGA